MILQKKILITAIRNVFIASAVCLAATAHAFAQDSNKKVTFPSRNIPVREVLAHIQKQTDFLLAVNLGKTDVNRNISLSAETLTVSQALDESLKAMGYEYMLDGRYVVVENKTKKPEAAPTILPQRYTGGYNIADTLVREQAGKPVVEYDTIVTVIPHNGKFTYEGRDFDPGYTGVSLPDSPYGNRSHTLSHVALKTNLLYGAAAFAPNLSLEVGTGGRTSIEMMGSWNAWNRKGTAESNKKLAHIIVKPEFRYWTCERFNGHYFGLHALLWRFNVAEHDIPLLFDKEYRYDGRAYGAGISYGYYWAWSRHWGMEFNVGAGVAMMNYRKYDCTRCSQNYVNEKKTYIGPTSAGIKIVFMIK